MDGIDAAILKSDGTSTYPTGLTHAAPFTSEDRVIIRAAVDAAQNWVKGDAAPVELAAAEAIVTTRHVEAVEALLAKAGMSAGEIDVIGFHGQTVLHRPEQQWTVQLGNAAALAKACAIDVVADFRSADVAAGGQGAPFAPLYHAALVASLEHGKLPEGPVVVVNMGGVGNVTYMDGDTILAFDTGPANGPIDDWVGSRSDQNYDKDGAIGARGMVDQSRIDVALMHEYFKLTPPKSLDRLDFTSALAKGLSLEDGTATLTAFSAASLAAAADHFPGTPVAWIICGGGRHNPTLVSMIRAQVSGQVYVAEDMGWRGDEVEAEAFAFLAVRSLQGLPLSVPGTTGVPEPKTGGVIFHKN